nr:unnamed protein product [Spirometra erinaceieuropaei]
MPPQDEPQCCKDNFYEDLQAHLTNMSKADKSIVLGEFNACVETDHAVWQGVLGLHGLFGSNDDCMFRSRTFAKHRLILTSTFFCLPEREKATWRHPRSREWHLLDYVLVRRRDQRDVLVAKAVAGSDGWTDHRLVISKTRIRLQPHRRPQAVYGPPTKGTAPLLNADGSTLPTEKTQILQRWDEHFGGVRNRPSTTSDAAIARLPQLETNSDLDLLSSPQETSRAEQQLSIGKDRPRSLLITTGTVASNSWSIRRRSSRRCGVKETSHKISKMPLSFICRSGKETASSATIIDTSPYKTSSGKSLLASSSTA